MKENILENVKFDKIIGITNDLIQSVSLNFIQNVNLKFEFNLTEPKTQEQIISLIQKSRLHP